MKNKEEIAYIIKPLFAPLKESELEEIIALAQSAGANVYGYKTQLVKQIAPATLIGSGKLEEIRFELEDSPVNLIIFDGDLTSSQAMNISEILGGRKVIDRTALILDIFALNAKSTEGKLQVELAQLNYLYPRLKGKGSALSQQGAGIGTRGPGETSLETNRRYLRGRIHFLKERLKEIEARRKLQSDRRKKNEVRTVALVGYTNTGKSTLLNALTDAGVETKNQLFATLDPTLRKTEIEQFPVVFADTVGFIRNIPHDLVEAFRSTLESAVNADLILIVCDAKADWEMQLKTTQDTLRSLNCDASMLIVFNKCDGIEDFSVFPKDAIFISALIGAGLNELKEKVIRYFQERFITATLSIPYAEFKIVQSIRESATVLRERYVDSGIELEVSAEKKYWEKIKPFVIEK